MMSPTIGLIRALGTPVNESASTTAFNKSEFNIVTSSGPMQGRIVGNDGSYDPANNLFHGMNRTSKFGNLRFVLFKIESFLFSKEIILSSILFCKEFLT